MNLWLHTQDTAGVFVWANDNQTIFYVTKDELDRPFKASAPASGRSLSWLTIRWQLDAL